MVFADTLESGFEKFSPLFLCVFMIKWATEYPKCREVSRKNNKNTFISMKKNLIFATLFVAVFLSSCKLAIVPKAINTINSVGLEELNLERKDYKVLNTITAESSVIYKQFGNKITISDANGDFSLTFKRRFNFGKGYTWEYKSFKGVARYGFLANDYGKIGNYSDITPEQIARNIAIYRLINACKVAGGDGVIEPIVSTNVGQDGLNIVFKTTVSAKIIKLNTDK